MERGWCKALACVAAWLSIFVLAGEAAAQPSAPTSNGSNVQETAHADALFKQALQLMKDGKTAEACDLLADSHITDPAIGTKLHLADCYERTDRPEDALALFEELEEMLKPENLKLRDRTPLNLMRAQVAAERAKALREKLGTLVLRLRFATTSVPGLTLTLDGRSLDASVWLGEPMRVLVGEHVLEISAPGLETMRSTIAISKTDGFTEIPVDLPAATSQPIEEKASEKSNPTPIGPKVPPPNTSIWTPSLVGGISAAFVGAGLLGGGIGALAVQRTLSTDPDFSEEALDPAGPGFAIALGAAASLTALMVLRSIPNRPTGKPAAMLVPWIPPRGAGAAFAIGF